MVEKILIGHSVLNGTDLEVVRFFFPGTPRPFYLEQIRCFTKIKVNSVKEGKAWSDYRQTPAVVVVLVARMILDNRQQQAFWTYTRIEAALSWEGHELLSVCQWKRWTELEPFERLQEEQGRTCVDLCKNLGLKNHPFQLRSAVKGTQKMKANWMWETRIQMGSG